MATFGKACGGFGAFIAGSENFIECIKQFGRTYIYTTALPPLLTYTNYELLKEAFYNNSLRNKLENNIKYFLKLAKENNINLLNKYNVLSPIQIILINNNVKTLEIFNYLKNKSILISAIRYPTVPKNQARLRITLSARHEFKDIKNLIKNLALSF